MAKLFHFFYRIRTEGFFCAPNPQCRAIIEDKSISYNTKKMNVIDFVDNANMNSEEYSNVIADIFRGIKE